VKLAAPTLPTENKIKVLAVDDHPENLIALEAALSDCGYDLITAESGRAAVELVKVFDFAVILMDVQMPEMDGFEAAQRIHSDFRSRTTPIIFVTAIYRSDEYERIGYTAGAVDYLFKPLNIEILKAKVAVFTELFRKNEENQRQAELLKVAALRDQENELLKAAVLARDEFLSMVVHELKTPITPLNLQIDAFIKMYEEKKENVVPRETQLRLLRISKSQTERLSRLINELVDVSRITAGKLDINPEPMDLVRLTQDVLQAFSEETKQAGCTIEVKCPNEVIGVWDHFRIEQVIINLLTNALKYGSGKPVFIDISKESHKTIFSIRDHGVGIASEDQERIFERFERAVSSKNYGGLGIGLFIACRIVKLHGGTIRVESRLGEGAKFIVELT
jgi:signal transduction histidine kinase